MENESKEVVNEDQQNNNLQAEETENVRGVWSTVRIIIVIGAIITVLFVWWRNNHNQNEFYGAIYEQAQNSIRNDFSGVANLQLAGYDKDRITQGLYEFHDFGEGQLRYAVFTVNVPIEYDGPLGHMELAPNVTVYYYSSNQNVSEGIDASVPAHFHIVGVDDAINNAFEDTFSY